MKKSVPWLIIGILAWAFLDGFQSYFTELDPDEAYYWMYSKKLAWGYFDHPPMVALMIKLGYSLFPNELGVRLMTIVMHSGTIFLVWMLAGQKKEGKELLSLFLLLGAIPMFQLYGFITTPDPPLFFFTAFFFWAYHLFLQKDSWNHTLLLGIAMVLMLYSKYHGVLIILFTLISNLKLLKTPRFYLASIFGALLFVPHLWWQFEQEFPSLKYHLVGRNDPYAIKHTLNYLVNQLINFSPLLIPLWWMSLKNWNPKNLMHRAYIFTIYGFLGFFLLATIKGHAEPQWTAVLAIPLVVLGMEFLRANPGRRKLFHRLSILSILLVFIARILLMTPIGEKALPEFHKKVWIQALKEQAGDRPVLFVDNYRDPSTYSFYSGDFSTAINDPVSYRRNQFDIWSYEEKYHKQNVLLFGLPEWVYCRQMNPFKVARKNRKTCEADNIQITQKVLFEFSKPAYLISKGNKLEIRGVLSNPYSHDLDFQDPSWKIKPLIYIIHSDKQWEADAVINIQKIDARSNPVVQLTANLPILEKGTYQMAFMLEGNGMIYSMNSGLVKLEFE